MAFLLDGNVLQGRHLGVTGSVDPAVSHAVGDLGELLAVKNQAATGKAGSAHWSNGLDAGFSNRTLNSALGSIVFRQGAIGVALDTEYDERIAAEAVAAAARAAIQTDVDGNEADADASFTAATTDRALIRTQFAAADAAIQADVDGNEADADASFTAAATDRALIRTQFAAADTAEVAARDAAISAAVASLIDSAPGALDTLNELAAAIGDDENYATTMTNALAGLQGDVNQNETDGDNDRAAIRSEIAAAKVVDDAALASEYARALAAEGALDGRLGVLEAKDADSFTTYDPGSEYGTYRLSFGSGSPQMSLKKISATEISMELSVA